MQSDPVRRKSDNATEQSAEVLQECPTLPTPPTRIDEPAKKKSCKQVDDYAFHLYLGLLLSQLITKNTRESRFYPVWGHSLIELHDALSCKPNFPFKLYFHFAHAFRIVSAWWCCLRTDWGFAPRE
jgi:hypothetical protein